MVTGAPGLNSNAISVIALEILNRRRTRLHASGLDSPEVLATNTRGVRDTSNTVQCFLVVRGILISFREWAAVIRPSEPSTRRPVASRHGFRLVASVTEASAFGDPRLRATSATLTAHRQ